jgi:hypothetical protein
LSHVVLAHVTKLKGIGTDICKKKQATSGWWGNKETISRTGSEVKPVMSGKAGKVSDKRID